MPEVISRLLSSRKFVVAITALVVAIAARLGLPADVAQEIAGAVLAIGATYVAAQGYADGKAAPPPPAPPAEPEPVDPEAP
jgi:phosphate/sulfate permease